MTKRLILADSACDLNDKIKKRLNIELVPFHIDIDGESILDNLEVNRKDFLKQMESVRTKSKKSLFVEPEELVTILHFSLAHLACR